jgi:hypothetical protein
LLYRVLADAVVAVHVGYVAFVVVGQLLIWAGLLLRWRWVRNPVFRWVHLAMMVVVGLEAVFDIICPLTRLEANLRRWAGQSAAGESFLGRLLHDLIFVDLPPAVLSALHISFALLVLATFVLAPPRPWTGRRFRTAGQGGTLAEAGRERLPAEEGGTRARTPPR